MSTLHIATSGHGEREIVELGLDLAAAGWRLIGTDITDDGEWLGMFVEASTEAADVIGTLDTLRAIGFEASPVVEPVPQAATAA